MTARALTLDEIITKLEAEAVEAERLRPKTEYEDEEDEEDPTFVHFNTKALTLRGVVDLLRSAPELDEVRAMAEALEWMTACAEMHARWEDVPDARAAVTTAIAAARRVLGRE